MGDKIKLYDSLKKKMIFNKKQIEFLKKTIIVLSILFVIICFMFFYKISILKESDYNVICSILLFVLFIGLTTINFYKKKKEKETRNIDTQIYELLKLRI